MPQPLDYEKAREELPHAGLQELANAYARLLMTVDGYWFLEIEKLLGVDETIRIDEAVWSQYGSIEARRLKRIFSAGPAADLERIRRIFSLSPSWRAIQGETDIEDGKLRVSVSYCHVQDARVKRGMDTFPCRSVETAYFQSFFTELNPAARFQCTFCPPEPRRDDRWCE
jgi:hypothetical protein